MLVNDLIEVLDMNVGSLHGWTKVTSSVSGR